MYNQDKSFQPLEKMISNICSIDQYNHSLHTIVYDYKIQMCHTLKIYLCLAELYCKFIKPNKKQMCFDICYVKRSPNQPQSILLSYAWNYIAFLYDLTFLCIIQTTEALLQIVYAIHWSNKALVMYKHRKYIFFLLYCSNYKSKASLRNYTQNNAHIQIIQYIHP